MAEPLHQGRAFSRPPLYVSNKNETVRMFESDFMEFFSRVHPMTPLVLYLPVVGYMLYVSVWQRQFSLVAVAALFLLGILLWTLTEYLIHRYIFHYEPKTRANWEASALHRPRRSSRLPKRRAQARDAAQHQRSTGLSFLRYLPSDFLAADAGRLCRAGFRLYLLRHASLRDASFSDEARRVALAEAVSSSPSL